MDNKKNKMLLLCGITTLVFGGVLIIKNKNNSLQKAKTADEIASITNVTYYESFDTALSNWTENTVFALLSGIAVSSSISVTATSL